ncbi:hypothetical protein CA606_18110 [Caulobacter vibrioides]|uniref:Uncharacterized protein n=1 Tax=Caulobacter vibrioides TaxID=155892 RepID=A0A290MQ17_CAUVI|nr:hypothetical protein [Caulobacter vibrioides]ATC34089.1 hypothetical protein CA606_18110 [Caulobacter vibrioides]
MISRAEFEEAMLKMAELNTQRATEIRALDRLVMALACIGVDQAADRTAYTEKLRGMALGAVEQGSDPRVEPLRERLELLLAKIEAWSAQDHG